jgi:hypothetical protein
MAVTKSVRECYEVRENHEWANITLACWDRPANVGTPHETTYYCGEITIQSSFGTWGYVWTACGVPFKRFLMRAEFDYVFTKFMGVKLQRHDGDGTLQQLRRDIIEQRRQGSIDKTEARDVWSAVDWESERIESDPTSCGYALMEVARQIGDSHPMHDHFADPCAWSMATRPDSQAVGFWRELWPSFIAELRRETEPVACAA